MKILILGAGQVGSSAAYHLSKEDANEVTVVDVRPDILRDLQDRLDITPGQPENMEAPNPLVAQNAQAGQEMDVEDQYDEDDL